MNPSPTPATMSDAATDQPDDAVLGIDHVQVAMPPGGEAQARAFYGQVLGLAEEPKPAPLDRRGGVWFRCAHQGLHLGIEETFVPATKAHAALLVRDLAAMRERLHDVGAVIVEDDNLPGYERFYTQDPFGNRLELLRPLAPPPATDDHAMPVRQASATTDDAVATEAKARVRATYTAAADAYVTSATHASGHDLDRLLELVAPQPGERALDLSTGGGHVALALARAGAIVTALDLTPAMLAAARAHLRAVGVDGVSYVVGDAERLPFLDASFDLVTVRIAPHHYVDIPAALREVARVLRPGGRFGLVDNIVPEDPRLATLMNSWEQRRDPSHVRALPLSTWEAILAEAGLRITTLEVGRKSHPFTAWAARTHMSAEARTQLAHDMLAADDAARSAFDIVAGDDGVRSWSCDYLIARAEPAH